MSFVPNLSIVTGDSLLRVLEAKQQLHLKLYYSNTILTVDVPVTSTVVAVNPTLLASILNGASISTVIE